MGRAMIEMYEPKHPALNADQTVAVDRDYFWQPMSTCPRGVKCQLLGAGGVAIYASWDGKDDFWQGWAPLPKRRPEQHQ